MLAVGAAVTLPAAVNDDVAPPPEIEMVSAEMVDALIPAFNLVQTVLAAKVPVPVYVNVAVEPKPVDILVVDTSKLVEPVNVMVPPPAVKLEAVIVLAVAVEGPEPAT